MIGSYLKDALESVPQPNASRLFRLKILFYTSISMAIVIFLGVFARHLANPIKPLALYTTIISGFILLLVPKIYAWTKNQTITSYIPLICCSLIISVASYTAGGLRAPINALSILMPILATFFLGQRGGMVFFAVALANSITYYFLTANNLLPPSSLKDTESLTKALFIVPGACLCISLLIGYLYERERKRSIAIKDRLINNISHELRTPLTAVIGAVKLREFSESEQDKAMLQEILERNCQQLQSLLSDILDAQRLGGAKIVFKPVRLGISSFLSEFADEYPRVKVSAVPADLAILVDYIRLRQILSNLITNALKFSPDNSKVELGAKEVDTQGKANVVFWVKDFGRGIKKEHLAEIFTRFFQSSLSDSNKDRGMGLGLHIAKQLVNSQGGQIWVESDIGVGSTFYLSFPKAEETQDQVAA